MNKGYTYKVNGATVISNQPKDYTHIVLTIKKIDDEYQVQWFENGKYSESKTYYTDDRMDAIETKDAMYRKIKEIA